MHFFVLILAIPTALLSANALPTSGSDYTNAPACWALIDSVRSILIYNEIDPSNSQVVQYAINEHREFVKPATWTVIQSTDKRDVRYAESVVVTKSSTAIFPPYIFFHFYQMNMFSMVNQQIASIKMADFEGATHHLTHLNLSHNVIDGLLPYTFNNAKHLEVIDLSYNAISNIVGEIFTSEHLRELYLDHNNLTYLEFAWLNFDALEVLTLNDNQLFNIDVMPSPHQSEFGEKHSLTAFNLANNPLTPDSSDTLAMYADTVNISNINANACIIPMRVRTFVARRNRIGRVIALPASENYTLIELDLAYNALTSLVNLTQFHRLMRLDLSHNLLDALPAQQFLRMRHLVWLNLANNILKTIDFGFLRSTNALAYLDISYNELSHFRLNTITLSLEELHVEGNNLTRLDMNLRRVSPNLTRIGLRDNDWGCNYLMTAVMLLQFDGILPVIRATGDSEDAASERYKDNVKGIGCSADSTADEVVSAAGNNTDAMERRFQKLETKLMDVIDIKFVELSSRIDDTANDLLSH